MLHRKGSGIAGSTVASLIGNDGAEDGEEDEDEGEIESATALAASVAAGEERPEEDEDDVGRPTFGKNKVKPLPLVMIKASKPSMSNQEEESKEAKGEEGV